MFSNKENINILTALLRAHGIERAVVCPGSRNAPIVHNLSQVMDCTPITDERSAGFYALGLAEATGNPVVVCVTSGTALLNLTPAVAEASYLHVPVVVISADRPTQWIDQLDGQTLPQPGSLVPFVRYTVSLPEPQNSEERWHCNRLINEALCLATHREPAPIHINVPLSEPLFDFCVPKLPKERIFQLVENSVAPPFNAELEEHLSKARRVMLVVGCTHQPFLCSRSYYHSEDKTLNELCRTFAVLYEPLAAGARQALPIDEMLRLWQNCEEELYPDLIIYVGGTIVSKRLRHFLRRSGAPTWLITMDASHISDPTMHLERIIECSNIESVQNLLYAMWNSCHKTKCFDLIPPNITTRQKSTTDQTFVRRWQTALAEARNHIESRVLDFSAELVVREFECALIKRGKPAEVHYANSLAIRLACLYAHHHVWCNRGVNGIEGSLSTAAGFSLASSKPVFCIIGDLSFFYDQNALWNDRLTGNLHILLLNNGGGGIFQKLSGLEKAGASLPLINGQQQCDAQGICQQNAITYITARSKTDYAQKLEQFLSHQGPHPIVLEVMLKTEDRKTNRRSCSLS